MEKLDLLGERIISLLRRREPEFLRWSEIVNDLWQEPFTKRYKDRRGFGVAVTNKLRLLEAGGKIEHEGHCYRIRQSSEAERDTVRAALEELRKEFRYLRDPRVKEIAERIGKPPGVVEPIVYALIRETGWSEPDENAQTDARDAVNLAGWLNAEKNGGVPAFLKWQCDEAKARASDSGRRRAQNILTNYPELTPRIQERLLEWPDETRAVWYRVFKTEAPRNQICSVRCKCSLFTFRDDPLIPLDHGLF